jgi:AbrB family looped-hinge helix DNA binding protein
MNAKVSSRGYVVLPAKLRKEMNIKAGTQLLLKRQDDIIILQPVHSFTRELSGLGKGNFGRTSCEVDNYIDKERKER